MNVNVNADDLRVVLDDALSPNFEAAAARLRAALSETEPSDADIDAYCEGHWGCRSDNRSTAAAYIKAARKRGWDVVPRRLDTEITMIIRGESEPVGHDESMWWLLWSVLLGFALAAVVMLVLIALGAG